MKHLRKFNEELENSNPSYELIGCDSNEVGQITIGDKIADLSDGRELHDAYDENNDCVVIVKDGKIEVAIFEYEISNPFVFGDVIVVPGHDSITVYNIKTGENKTEQIR